MKQNNEIRYQTSGLMHYKPLCLIVFAVITSGCSQPETAKNKREIHTPSADFVADAVLGRDLYGEYCSQCHGKTGKGTKQGPPLIHKIYRRDHHSDMSFYKAAQLGTYQHHWHFGNMPPVENINPEQTGHIIAYIRGKQEKAGM